MCVCGAIIMCVFACQAFRIYVMLFHIDSFGLSASLFIIISFQFRFVVAVVAAAGIPIKKKVFFGLGNECRPVAIPIPIATARCCSQPIPGSPSRSRRPAWRNRFLLPPSRI